MSKSYNITPYALFTASKSKGNFCSGRNHESISKNRRFDYGTISIFNTLFKSPLGDLGAVAKKCIYSSAKLSRVTSLLVILLVTLPLSAQQLLTIDDAISRALKNNYNIQIARNNEEAGRINNTLGNAGMLPGVSLNGTGGVQFNDVNQKSATTGETHYPSLTAQSLSTNVELNWKLFDGGKMFVTRKKLSEIEAMGKIRFQEQVQQTVYNVIAAYYDVVRQKQQLKAINEAINFNRERVKIAQTAFTSGASAKTDLLQAKIDLNVYTENAVNQQIVIDASKRTLKVLLGENAEITYDVEENIPQNYQPERDKLAQRIFEINPSVLGNQKQIEIAKLALKENKGAVLPQFTLRTGYYFSLADNSAGSILRNRTFGPQIGGTLSVPLFTGGENKRKINLAKLDIESAKYTLEDSKRQIEADLLNALNEFDRQKELLQIEQENNLLTKENLDISLERLRLGQTTSLEVHQAQESYVQSSTRLTNFQYSLKIAEAKLKQLMAEL